MTRQMKVAIAGGAGGVGSSLAFNLLIRPEPYDVIVVDRRPEKVLSHVMDLEQVLTLGTGRSVRPGGCDDLEQADVVVVCAAAPLTENTTRDVYLADNARIVDGIAERLAAWDGVLIMVTNPVDALCTRLTRDRRRTLGYTLNDSLRLRTAIADARETDPRAVEAWVLGEHGEAAVPVFSRIDVDGARIALEPHEREAAHEFIRTWYRRHVALDPRRSSTWTTGAGLAEMIAGLRTGLTTVASVRLDGEYGIAGVSLGVPVTLGPDGVETIHEWELDPDELAGLQWAAEVIRRPA
jgi:malate/lactate dehydrogenase